MSNTATLQEGQFIVQNCRLGYPKLYVAKAMENDPTSKPRFGCQIYLPKTDEATKAKMVAGGFDIFKGPIKDNKGNVVIAAGKTYKQTAIELESMNYLVEGVIGSF